MVTGRIKIGTRCSQDHRFFRWPDIPGKTLDPDKRFNFRPTRTGGIEATSDGFGFGVSGQPKGNYGNGGIYIYKIGKP